MFPKQRMQYYAEMTKRYDAQKGRNLEVDGDDIEQFFDILLFNGYHSVPSENMLSSISEDLIMPLVSGTMNRNRFRELKRNFPMMENTELLPEDKLNKISAISSSNLSSDVTESFVTESNRYSSSLSVSSSDISTLGKTQLYS
ncbi:PiggyBac transposable element-derived protein 3 [Trichinella patagoniensis]|uniref:PiggyBac transposable element-derived protein 3 n=1 Tax=Trichinella patagoniensis TaxID=990121 RepID=A0A0V0Z6I6_9BILA|nr:PiggyBac transposable element-derived protein 3 [Trichinella patagoniensis]